MAAQDLSHAELRVLVDSARELSSEIDLHRLLDKILDQAGRLTNSPSGSVLLYDEVHDGFYFAAATGPKAGDVLAMFGEHSSRRIPRASKAGESFSEGKTLVEASVVSDPNHFKGVDRRIQHRTESMLCVPLAIGPDRLGVVQLLNKSGGDYDARDIALVEHFAIHAALAIRNARHVRDLLAHKGLFTSATSVERTEDLLKLLNAPARKVEASVMFADMRGFTRLTQSLLDPNRIEQHLNEFLTLLANSVLNHGGLVNKFLGDGVLALFQDKGKEERSARAAFDIISGFEELRDRWNRDHNEDLSFLDVGIGIVTDEVVLGSIGSGRVRDFTALGNSVNLAAAFEHDARNGKRIIIDTNTRNRLKSCGGDFADLPPYELRKDDQPSGITYKRYHLKRLRAANPAEALPAAASAVGSSHSARLQPYYQNSWAIVVGVNRYRSPKVAQLSYAVADARAVADALPRLGFPRERIDVLENEQATRESVMRTIYEKKAVTQHEDRLLIFFALHGSVDRQKKGDEGYLMPWDVDPENMPLTAIPMAELAQIGRRVPPKHILFVLDTCFSGFARKRDMQPAPQSDLTTFTREPVVQLLAAGTSEQRAIEESGHGIFTRHFLKGLEGWADLDKTGLTALKLSGYVQERVLHDSGGLQTPQYAKLEGEGEFLFLPPGG